MSEPHPTTTTAPAPARAAGAGARALLASQGVRVAVTGLGIVLLSRLLTPEDFGVVAVVAAVMNVAVIVGDLGLSVAAIREPTLSRTQWTALFWVNAGFGLALALALAALAGPVAAAAGETGSARYFVAVAPVFLLGGCSVQYRVQLVRDARFAVLGAAEALAPLLGLVVAVVLALAGAGPWALVAQLVTGPAALLVLAVAAVRRAPGLPRRAPGVARMLALGLTLSVQQVLDAAANAAGPLALGRSVAPGAVGAFSRGTQLVKLPHQQLAGSLTRVVVPALAAADAVPAVAGGPTELERRLRTARATYGYVVGLATALVGGLAAPTVAVVLGPQWTGTTPTVVSVLAAGLVLQSVSYVFLWGLTAVGATRALLRAEIPVYALILAGVVVAAPHGVVAVAAVYAGGTAVRTLARLAVGPPALGISRRRFLASALPNLAVLAVVLGGGLVLTALFPGAPAVLLLIAGTAWAAAVLALARAASREVRADLRTAARQVARVVGLRKPPEAGGGPGAAPDRGARGQRRRRAAPSSPNPRTTTDTMNRRRGTGDAAKGDPSDGTA